MNEFEIFENAWTPVQTSRSSLLPRSRKGMQMMVFHFTRKVLTSPNAKPGPRLINDRSQRS